jgi:transposase
LESYFRRDEASRTRSALEVGDIEQALDFYGNIFDFKLRERGEGATFIDLGDPILPPCVVGLEACATAHYWARELGALGHEVRLMPAQYVKA